MKSMEHQFIDWVSKQDPKAGYNYFLPGNCAICQFLADAGYAEEPRVVPFDWRDGLLSEDRHPYPRRMDKAAHAEPWTFGALAERLAS